MPRYRCTHTDTHAIAIPTEQGFWDLLLAKAAASGVTLWKQDWLASLFELSHRAGEDVTTAATFHRQLAQAAASRDMPSDLASDGPLQPFALPRLRSLLTNPHQSTVTSTPCPGYRRSRCLDVSMLLHCPPD